MKQSEDYKVLILDGEALENSERLNKHSLKLKSISLNINIKLSVHRPNSITFRSS